MIIKSSLIRHRVIMEAIEFGFSVLYVVKEQLGYIKTLSLPVGIATI